MLDAQATIMIHAKMHLKEIQPVTQKGSMSNVFHFSSHTFLT